MKKTFNINLGGQIFHIDDDAFNKLEAYLGALRQQFSSTSGGDEILNDVETRMAELFKERTANTKEVINIQDVDEAIAIIGKPEDFWHEDEASQGNFQYDNTMSYQKRVMRDVDNRVLGGVASGLAAYFNIDTLWIRLLFVALMFAGFGVLLYIILWLVVPAARTTTEKLQMRGKPVTLSNIEDFVRDEAHAVGANVSKLRGRAGDYGRGGRSVLANFFSAILDIIKMVFKFIFKLVGFFFLGIGFIVLVSILLTLFIGVEIADYNYTIYEAADLLQIMSVDSGIYNGITLGTSLLIIGPLFLIIYYGLRLLFSVEPLNKGVRNGLLLTTLLGLVILSISGARLAKNFNTSKTISTEQGIEAPNGMINLNVIKDSIYDYTQAKRYDDFWILVDGKSYFNDVEFDVRRSSKGHSYLKKEIKAHGANRQEARNNTETLNFSMSVDSNSINASNYFTIKEGSYYRGQSIELTLYLAEGDTVFFAPGTEKLLYDVQNVQNYWDADMVGHAWIMTSSGLSCVDCPKDDYYEEGEVWEDENEIESSDDDPEIIIEDDKIIIREAYLDQQNKAIRFALVPEEEILKNII